MTSAKNFDVFYTIFSTRLRQRNISLGRSISNRDRQNNESFSILEQQISIDLHKTSFFEFAHVGYRFTTLNLQSELKIVVTTN